MRMVYGNEIVPIIFDTSCVFNNRVEGGIFNEPDTIGEIIRIRDYFSYLHDGCIVKILLPEVVIRERKVQQTKLIGEKINQFNFALSEIPKTIAQGYQSIEVEEREICDDVQKEIDEFLSKNGIETIPFPLPNHFDEIINLALDKERPFSEDDRGFKDTLIGILFMITFQI
jgi:hypothetical protein